MTPPQRSRCKGLGTPKSWSMTHIAIVEVLDGKSADWMEKVSDEQYLA
jgi:hypothetical protein